ncbi:hypothetical protein MATL_G00232750 [Megalops atlanticus]|uniref:Uncharacterized protein n=1 Tax=Megalops atlanticus TaxID=7932 RepID=A0A9D3PFG6_MEGAT|nr:hypothetical protein MATL_G00232750 [Megalops atlanticus]
MSQCTSFHTQLVSVMETLTKAAIAEICKLVNDGNVVLRSEMCRRQTENEVLKTKLKLLESELRLARKHGRRDRRAGYGGSLANSCAAEVHISDRSRSTAERVMNSEWSAPHGTEELSPQQESSLLLSVAITDEQSSETEGDGPESFLIKEERPKEDLGNRQLQEGLKTGGEGAIEHIAEDAALANQQHCEPRTHFPLERRVLDALWHPR